MLTTIEERVAYLEGKVEEHSRAWEDLKNSINNLEAGIDKRFSHLEGRINALDEKVDRRIDALDQKVDRFKEELSGRIDTLDQRLSRYSLWIIGIQVTILLAIIGVLLKV